MIKLGNLIALRQIGIEIILTVEPRIFVDLRLDRPAGAHRLADALAVRDREHARHGSIYQRHLRARFRPDRRPRARTQTGVGCCWGRALPAELRPPLPRSPLATV